MILTKDKILIFVIGLLLGAVITTGAFFAYSKATTCNTNNTQINAPGGTPPSMPGGQNSENGQPPEKPDTNNTLDNNQNNN